MAHVERIRKPRSLDTAAWRALRTQAGRDTAAFNKQARALIRDAQRQLRAHARELAKRRRDVERAWVKERRALLRVLRKDKLFEPPKSAFRSIQTKRGPRRLLKRSYLLRSPKLKAAIAANQSDTRVTLRERLFGIFPRAREYPGAFNSILWADPVYVAQLNTLADDDLQTLIRIRNEDYNEALAELLGEQPIEHHRMHPLWYHGGRTITGVAD